MPRCGKHAVRALLSLLLAITLLATVSRAALSLDNDGIAADPLLDRASPRATMDGFLQAGAAGQYRRAAQFLDLRSMSSSQQASEGPGRAEQLYYVLTRELTVDLERSRQIRPVMPILSPSRSSRPPCAWAKSRLPSRSYASDSTMERSVG